MTTILIVLRSVVVVVVVKLFVIHLSIFCCGCHNQCGKFLWLNQAGSIHCVIKINLRFIDKFANFTGNIIDISMQIVLSKDECRYKSGKKLKKSSGSEGEQFQESFPEPDFSKNRSYF
jgi:hypothetical protein